MYGSSTTLSRPSRGSNFGRLVPPQRFQLPLRDSHLLDPSFASATSAVLARDRVIVVKLESFRALISAEEARAHGAAAPHCPRRPER